MNEADSGFLVVLPALASDHAPYLALNPQYTGVYRVPTYPSKYIEEASAIDDYVFAGIKSDETNVIPTFDAALELWKRFSSSPREFEIILCCTGPNDPLMATFRPQDVVVLGYDVAGLKGDGWSIVGDPAPSEWARPFLSSLNEFGLFHERADAVEYLRLYIEHGEPDADSGFDIVYVVRVFPGKGKE